MQWRKRNDKSKCWKEIGKGILKKTVWVYCLDSSGRGELRVEAIAAGLVDLYSPHGKKLSKIAVKENESLQEQKEVKESYEYSVWLIILLQKQLVLW